MAETETTDRRGARRAQIEARQREAAEAARRRERQTKLRQWALFGLLGLGLLVAIGYVVRETTAPLPGVAVADEGRAHTEPPERVSYRSYPPSSGTHYGTVPPVSSYVLHAEPVQPEFYVHALEHGSIVIVYNCRPEDCEQLRRDLGSLYGQVSRSKWGHVKLLITPDPSIDPGIVVLAWNRRLDLDRFDAEKIKAFYHAFVDRGPEDAP